MNKEKKGKKEKEFYDIASESNLRDAKILFLCLSVSVCLSLSLSLSLSLYIYI
jgi:hypothetical protein